MESIIVFVDEARHALRELVPMRSADKPTRWIIVGCTPRLSRHISRWVSNRSRRIWQDKWCEDVLRQLQAQLGQPGDQFVMRLASKDLVEQTRLLKLEFGSARVLDARRPKLGEDLPPVTPDQPAENRGTLATIGSTSALGAMLLLTSD